MEKRSDEIVFIVEEDESGGFCARAVGHAIFTQGETLDETREMIKDAVLCHFDDDECPETMRIQARKRKATPSLFYVPIS